MGFNHTIDFIADAKHLSAETSMHSLIFLVRLHSHIHNCPVQAHSSVQWPTRRSLADFIMEETLQDALKEQTILFPWQNTVE